MYAKIRLLVLIHLLIYSFFFLSCFQTFFLGTVRHRYLKLNIKMKNGCVYLVHVFWNEAANTYLSLYVFFFVSLHFSVQFCLSPQIALNRAYSQIL